MKVAVFGAGYVGLVQSAVLAEVGNQVIGVDINQQRVNELKQGNIPIYEPGLSPIIIDAVEHGTLSFTTDAKSAVNESDIIFIAVGTPPDEDGGADLQHVLGVAATIASTASGSSDKIVVTKSTVPVGTADKVVSTLEQNRNPGFTGRFHVASNPEFLKEGAAVADCKKPDRIVIGCDSDYAIEKLSALYAPFNRNHDRIYTMSPRSAELTKYAANCMLATKISFMNEMSNLAEAMGADIEEVRKGIGCDPRIGYHFIYPGCGYGGSCFPKDVKAMIYSGQKVGGSTAILDAVEKVNERQKSKILSLVDSHYGGGENPADLSGKTFAIWGLAFKPKTDDMRESPSLTIIRGLLERGATVQAFDPEATQTAAVALGEHERLQLVDSQHAATNNASALILCTEWEIFRSLDFSDLATKISDRVLFDGRNIYRPEDAERHGIAYYGIGRGRSIKR